MWAWVHFNVATLVWIGSEWWRQALKGGVWWTDGWLDIGMPWIAFSILWQESRALCCQGDASGQGLSRDDTPAGMLPVPGGAPINLPDCKSHIRYLRLLKMPKDRTLILPSEWNGNLEIVKENYPWHYLTVAITRYSWTHSTWRVQIWQEPIDNKKNPSWMK